MLIHTQAFIAQRLEQEILNFSVVGSNPTEGTDK